MIGEDEEESIGIVPSKRRWERKQRARDRSVKFQGHAGANNNNNNLEKVSPAGGEEVNVARDTRGRTAQHADGGGQEADD